MTSATSCSVDALFRLSIPRFGWVKYKHCAPCLLLKLHQLQLIRFGHIYHVIDVPMNSVDGLIEDDKSEVVSVVCVLVPVCNPLTFKCPLVLGHYLRFVQQR